MFKYINADEYEIVKHTGATSDHELSSFPPKITP